MATRKRKDKPLPTIWHVPDELWELIQPILNQSDPPAATETALRPRAWTTQNDRSVTWASLIDLPRGAVLG